MDHQIKYTVVRSGRRTLGLQVKKDGEIIVRAPYKISQAQIDRFVKEHEEWLLKHLEKAEKQSAALENVEKLTAEEIKKLADQACRIIPGRVAYYAPKIGVTYGGITIRNQKTRWGSCSSKGNLNFNCLLMLAPPEVIDSVVVHELCHRKEMNHSKRFYDEVLKVFPEYHQWNGWLKEHGNELLARLP